MSYKLYEIEDQKSWDQLVLKYAGNSPFQLWFRGEALYKFFGFAVKRILITSNGLPALLAQIVFRTSADNKICIHIEQGPIITNNDYKDSMVFFMSELRRPVKNIRNIFLKIEPTWPQDSHLEGIITNLGFFKGSTLIGPIHRTILIDLRKDLASLMAQMNQTTRRYIRNTQQRGVLIRRSSDEGDFDKFWQVLTDTAQRKNFFIWPKEFHLGFFKNVYPQVASDFFFADYQNQTAAAALVFYYKDTAYYYRGGSVPSERGMNVLKLLIWEAVQEAKRKGYAFFDLFGIDEHQNPGLMLFKRGFGGKEISYIGAYDYFF